jgi:hypothetical protein
MADPPHRQTLKDGDVLLRLLKPNQWNLDSLAVAPEAFLDQHEDLSFFVARLKPARDVLKYFGSMGGIKRAYFGNTTRRSAEEMWAKGFGVAAIRHEDVVALGLRFRRYADGFEVQKHGHVEVVHGKVERVELSYRAKPLTEREIFGR